MRNELWRVLLAASLVAIVLAVVVAIRTHSEQRYHYSANCNSHGVCVDRVGHRRPPELAGAIILAVMTVATAGLIVAWRRFPREQALRLLGLLLAAWAFAVERGNAGRLRRQSPPVSRPRSSFSSRRSSF